MCSSPDRVKPKIINWYLLLIMNAKHVEFRRKSKDWLARNQDNVSEWSDMYIRGLLFPLVNTIKKRTKRVGLEKSGHHHHLINLVSLWYSYKIAELALNNNRSLTKAVTYSFYISPTMYVYCVYSAMSYSKKNISTRCKETLT